jgi:hypothetical protein
MVRIGRLAVDGEPRKEVVKVDLRSELRCEPRQPVVAGALTKVAAQPHDDIGIAGERSGHGLILPQGRSGNKKVDAAGEICG